MEASTIRGAMAAEGMLAREEDDEMDSTLDLLDDEHPLKQEALRAKAALGDLASLPPNHPLRVAIEEARMNWESAQEMQVPEGDPVEVRRAKKIDARKAKVVERRKEEDNEHRLRTAATLFNSSLVETMDSVRRLQENLSAAMDDLADYRYATMKLARLERMLLATERGLIESRITPGRLNNG